MAEKVNDLVQNGLDKHKCCFGGGECKQWAERKLRLGNCESRFFCEKHLLETLKGLSLEEQLEHINRMANAEAENAAKARAAALDRFGGKTMDATMYEVFTNPRVPFWNLIDVKIDGEVFGEITIAKGFTEPLVEYLKKKGYNFKEGTKTWMNIVRNNFG